jgi:hypothetical protein
MCQHKTNMRLNWIENWENLLPENPKNNYKCVKTCVAIGLIKIQMGSQKVQEFKEID